jgi:hypothetical protein
MTSDTQADGNTLISLVISLVMNHPEADDRHDSAMPWECRKNAVQPLSIKRGSGGDWRLETGPRKTRAGRIIFDPDDVVLT